MFSNISSGDLSEFFFLSLSLETLLLIITVFKVDFFMDSDYYT